MYPQDPAPPQHDDDYGEIISGPSLMGKVRRCISMSSTPSCNRSPTKHGQPTTLAEARGKKALAPAPLIISKVNVTQAQDVVRNASFKVRVFLPITPSPSPPLTVTPSPSPITCCHSPSSNVAFSNISTLQNNSSAAVATTEALFAILDQQQAIKTENSSVSSTHDSNAPASRGSGSNHHRLSPTAVSFDGSSSSLSGDVRVNAPMAPVPVLPYDATEQYKAAFKWDARPAIAARGAAWAAPTNSSPFEYPPTSTQADYFAAPSQAGQRTQTQPMWSTGSASHVPAASITTMHASMGNLSMGNEWAPIAPAQGAMKAPYFNQQIPMANQSEIGNFPRPSYDRSGYAPAVAGTQGYTAGYGGPSSISHGGAGGSSYPIPNDPSVMYVGDESYRHSMGSDNRPVSGSSNFAGRAAPFSNYQNSAVDSYNMRAGPPNNINNYYGPSQPAQYVQHPGHGPVGSRLSATATEFPYNNGMQTTPWNPQVSRPLDSCVYKLIPRQPMNQYRGGLDGRINYRLVDANASGNWRIIVERIIANNDQQASIFLQQKLKGGTAEQRFDIINAIASHAYLLMINRFGNFLIQRCFEYGRDDQIVKVAQAIQGHTLELSMDPFGCHVVQKAFDYVPENYKAVMVHELLRRIPETVVHRYACHVWQKLFELRWQDSPPQIMRFVNDALRGMWHEVALGETGSLVVQNIFENCLDEDKVCALSSCVPLTSNPSQRPCIDEVLLSIDVVAHGQFGNWCIQHICEHGAPRDSTRAIDHILRFATQYSTDQYASKVVEKCLKIHDKKNGINTFLERYLERVCELGSEASRGPRIPLIDSKFSRILPFFRLYANAVVSRIRPVWQLSHPVDLGQ